MDKLLRPYFLLKLVAKHIPMRRELKEFLQDMQMNPEQRVAKHIPMRRELKVFWRTCWMFDYRKSQSTSR